MRLYRKGQKVMERFFGPEMTLALHKAMIVTRQKFSQVMGGLSIEKLVNVHIIYRGGKMFSSMIISAHLEFV